MSDSDSQTETRPRWNWSPAMHAALLVLHPLSVFLPPWKAGERDARMAIGLLRVDPVRRRGVLCATYYLSVGAAKVMLSGLALFFIAVLVMMCLGWALQPGAGWLGEALMAIVAAVVIAGGGLLVLTFATSLIAACIGQKLWVDPWADPVAALDGRWPPTARQSIRHNWATLLGGIPAVMIPVIIGLIAFEQEPLLVMWASGMLGTIPAAWITRRTAARTPEECYPEPPHPDPANGPIVPVDVID